MINVSELITDPDFCTEFTIIRKNGSWDDGVWKYVEESIRVIGITHPASGKELEMLPECDETKNTRVFYGSGTSPHLNTENRIADSILYNNIRFKVVQEQDFDDFGYWQIMAVEEDKEEE